MRQRLGVLPDARGVYKRLSARENIAYFGELHGLDAATIAQRTARLSEALGMADFLDRRTEGFSQGQRTKTAIARALVHDPKNVILDEPTNGLDVMTTRGLREFLRQLRAEGRCVIFSSHIMPVSYTHLDVYKRQGQGRRGQALPVCALPDMGVRR